MYKERNDKNACVEVPLAGGPSQFLFLSFFWLLGLWDFCQNGGMGGNSVDFNFSQTCSLSSIHSCALSSSLYIYISILFPPPHPFVCTKTKTKLTPHWSSNQQADRQTVPFLHTIPNHTKTESPHPLNKQNATQRDISTTTIITRHGPHHPSASSSCRPVSASASPASTYYCGGCPHQHQSWWVHSGCISIHPSIHKIGGCGASCVHIHLLPFHLHAMH